MKRLLLAIIAILLLTGRVFAQGDIVARLYFVDIVQTGIYRSPAHFGGRVVAPDTELVGVQWALMDYGLIPQGLVAAEVDSTQQAYLDGLADVLAIPADLDATVTAGNVTVIRNALEARNIPGTWVNVGDSYRVVLREIAGYFQFMQRLTAITGLSPLTQGITLSTQFQNLAQVWQDAILQAAVGLGYDASGLTGTTTVRNILRGIASQSGLKVFYLGTFEL